MKLGYVIVYVQDVRATLEFYERAFGLGRRFVTETGEYGELETGATALAFVAESFVSKSHSFRKNKIDGEAAGIEIAFVVEDVPDAVKRAIEAGATLLKEPVTKPWGQTVAYVRDNNGVLVELCTAMG